MLQAVSTARPSTSRGIATAVRRDNAAPAVKRVEAREAAVDPRRAGVTCDDECPYCWGPETD